MPVVGGSRCEYYLAAGLRFTTAGAALLLLMLPSAGVGKWLMSSSPMRILIVRSSTS
jgi:hypothetical protein